MDKARDAKAIQPPRIDFEDHGLSLDDILTDNAEFEAHWETQVLNHDTVEQPAETNTDCDPILPVEEHDLDTTDVNDEGGEVHRASGQVEIQGDAQVELSQQIWADK